MNKIIPATSVVILGLASAGYSFADESLNTPMTYSANGGTTIGTAASVDITIGVGGGVTITQTGLGTYDGSDDTIVAVINNSDSVVDSLHLTSNNYIFYFDGDGVSGYSLASGTDSTGYGSADSSFSNIVYGSPETGDVNFAGGISANGGTDYFSLEEDLSGTAGGGNSGLGAGVPDGGSTVTLLGGVLLAVGALRRKFGFSA